MKKLRIGSVAQGPANGDGNMIKILIKHTFLEWLAFEMDTDKEQAETFAWSFLNELHASGGLEVVKDSAESGAT